MDTNWSAGTVNWPKPVEEGWLMNGFAKRTVMITLGTTTQGMLGECAGVWAPMYFQVWVHVYMWVGWLRLLKEHVSSCV